MGLNCLIFSYFCINVYGHFTNNVEHYLVYTYNEKDFQMYHTYFWLAGPTVAVRETNIENSSCNIKLNLMASLFLFHHSSYCNTCIIVIVHCYRYGV